MKWNSLRVIAVEASELGAVIDRPIVRSRDGVVFKILDVHAHEPLPHRAMTNDELRLTLDSGSWMPLHDEWPAERGRMTVVVSAELCDLAHTMGRTFGAGWTRLGEQALPARYLPSAEAHAWGLNLASALVAWADREVSEGLCGRRTRSELHRAEAAYQHTHGLCARGSAPRVRMYPSVGVLLEDLAPERWRRVMKQAMRELGLTREEITERVAGRKAELLGRASPRHAPPTHPSGRVLGGTWRLTGLLDSGGMGIVYAAEHINGGQTVAIKVLRPDDRPEVWRENVERFRREIFITQKVSHPGIVAPIHAGTDDESGDFYYAMEHLHGETLAKRQRRLGRPLVSEEILPIAEALLDILAAAHAAGVVHRDVKPDNIFLTNSNEVKLLDFGVARAAELPEITSPDRGLGTFQFMPPEQARGEKADALADIWAVGATMFSMLSGRRVHENAASLPQLLTASSNAPAPSLAAVAPQVPAAVVALVDRALAFLKEHRWRSAAEMRSAIQSAMNDRPSEVSRWLHKNLDSPPRDWSHASHVADTPRPEEGNIRMDSMEWIFRDPKCRACSKPVSFSKGLLVIGDPKPHECRLPDTWKNVAGSFKVIQCPQKDCSKYLLAADVADEVDLPNDLPRYSDLYFCPLCGTALREPGKETFLSKVRHVAGSTCTQTHRSHSTVSLYCILGGCKLVAEVALDLAEGEAGFQDPRLKYPVLYAGAELNVRYPRLRPGSVPWPLAIDPSSVIAELRDGRNPGWRIRVPTPQTWTLWSLHARYFNDASPDTVATIAPLPSISLNCGGPEIALQFAEAGQTAKTIPWTNAPHSAIRLTLPGLASGVPKGSDEALRTRFGVSLGLTTFSPRPNNPSVFLVPTSMLSNAQLHILPWRCDLQSIEMAEPPVVSLPPPAPPPPALPHSFSSLPNTRSSQHVSQSSPTKGDDSDSAVYEEVAPEDLESVPANVRSETTPGPAPDKATQHFATPNPESNAAPTSVPVRSAQQPTSSAVRATGTAELAPTKVMEEPARVDSEIRAAGPLLTTAARELVLRREGSQETLTPTLFEPTQEPAPSRAAVPEAVGPMPAKLQEEPAPPNVGARRTQKHAPVKPTREAAPLSIGVSEAASLSSTKPSPETKRLLAPVSPTATTSEVKPIAPATLQEPPAKPPVEDSWRLDWRDCTGQWKGADEFTTELYVAEGEDHDWPDEIRIPVRIQTIDGAAVSGQPQISPRPGTPNVKPIGGKVIREAGDLLVVVPTRELRGTNSKSAAFDLKMSGFHAPMEITLAAPAYVLTALDGLDQGPTGAWTLRPGATAMRWEISDNSFGGSYALGRVELRDNGGKGSRLRRDSAPFSFTVESAQPGEVVIDIHYINFIKPITRKLSISAPPTRNDIDVRQSGQLGVIPTIGSDPAYGVFSCPNLVVGRTIEIPGVLENKSAHDVLLSMASVLDREGRAEAGLASPIRVPAGATAEYKLSITPKPPAQRKLATWDFEIPILSPDVGATVAIEVPVEGVLEPQRSPLFFYDFGSSYTAIAGDYSGQTNILKEPGVSFVRSRLVATWRDEEDASRSWAPSDFLAPVSEEHMGSAEFQRRYCAYAVLEGIKTHFRLNSSRIVPVTRNPNANHRRTRGNYDVTAETFHDAQRTLASFIVRALGTVPRQVVTAFPIVLRGTRRQEAIRAMKEAFRKAGNGSNEVSIDARLDESTAAAMQTLLETDEGLVLVIDIGGGTTDITLFQVTPRDGGEPTVTCVGFDGMGIGGQWVTERVLALLVQKIRDIPFYLDAGGKFPIDDNHWNTHASASNRVILMRVAEAAKIQLQSGKSWSLSKEVLAKLGTPRLELLGATGVPLVPLEPDAISLEPADLFHDPEYTAYIDELIARAQHAGNLAYHDNVSAPSLTKVVLTGQASVCEHLTDRLASSLKPMVPIPQTTPQDRKLAVIRGLQKYCDEIRGVQREEDFQIGRLDRVVFLPVGTSGWKRVLLPRFHPLNVPVTLFSEKEVLQGRARKQRVLPRLRHGPDPRKEAFATGSGVTLGEGLVIPEAPLEATIEEVERAQLRYRYCLWIDDDDDLRGALYERWDKPLAVGTWTRELVTSHPALLLLRELLARGDEKTRFFVLDQRREQHHKGSVHPIRVSSADGEWATCSVAYSKIVDPASEWFLPFRPDDIALDGAYLVWAGPMAEGRRPWMPIAMLSSETEEISYRDLATGFVRRIVGRPLPGLPTVSGAKLPDKDRGLVLAFAISTDKDGGPVFVEDPLPPSAEAGPASKTPGTEMDHWWRPWRPDPLPPGWTESFLFENYRAAVREAWGESWKKR